MWDEYFTQIKLPISIDEFHRLPRNAAYKYEYFDGAAWLSPRPKIGRVVLKLAPRSVGERIDRQEKFIVRPIQEPDWTALAELFAAAFHNVQPFASLDGERRQEAARACIEHTRAGGDGPLVLDATFVAASEDDGKPDGAIVITMPKPRGAASEHESDDGPDRRPRLNWIFVHPWLKRHRLGEALLAASVNALISLGHRELVSSFLIGNEPSMLWHWRNGFELRSRFDGLAIATALPDESSKQ